MAAGQSGAAALTIRALSYRRAEKCLALDRATQRWDDVPCEKDDFGAVCKRLHVANVFVGDGWQFEPSGSCWIKYFNHIVGKQLTTFTRRTWAGAQAFCAASGPDDTTGGSLVALRTPETAAFVTELVYDPAGVNMAWQWTPVWIAGRKQGGVWQWVSSSGDQTPLAWTDWQPGEGQGGGGGFFANEDCIQMSHNRNVGTYLDQAIVRKDYAEYDPASGTWNDASCLKRRGYVCEICGYDSDGGQVP